jgi:predicted lipoprotein with Yx(FWY)xxD motif
MTRRRSAKTFLITLTAVPLAVVALTGCGGSDSNDDASAAPSPPQTTDGQAATIGVANTSLGDILIDSDARSLYLFGADQGTTSECTGDCAVQWPPVLASSTPLVGSGLNASMTGTTMRPDGTGQVTYNGHPLYEFLGDQKPGDTKGEGLNVFGGTWYVLDASGNQVTGSSSTTGGVSDY